MQRVLPSTEALALHGIAQTRGIEQTEVAALPPHTLMRRAGLATARLALAIAPHAERVWIAAGPGNNGGDGLEAALHLQSWGKQVGVSLVGDAASLPADAADALARAVAAGVIVDTERLAPGALPDLAIDALLGIGASRAPAGPLAEVMQRLNALRCPLLAIDLPSGLHADTGQPLGEVCVTAQHTLALLTLKPGLFTGAGRDHAGCVWIDRLDVTVATDAPTAWLAGTPAETTRHHVQHKGSFGDVAVVGGARGMVGAALLAARAAHAAGAGRVFVRPLDESVGRLGPVDAARPELMFRDELPDLARSTVVCGCGGGDAVRRLLPRLISGALRLVLDADALNAVASDTGLQSLLHARAARGLATVLTPHPLEAARLLGVPTTEVQADRLAAVQRLAERLRCSVLLKGSGTVVASPGQVPSINPTGNAALATAGTGDVLAGWLGGLWSQASDTSSAPMAAHHSAIAAAWMHGAAAERVAHGPLRAAELIERMHGQRREPSASR